jgi:hypothetical protein
MPYSAARAVGRRGRREENAYARCNRAMLQRALELARRPGRSDLHGMAAPAMAGGTDHMVQAVRTRAALHWIDTRALATSGDQPLAGRNDL